MQTNSWIELATRTLKDIPTARLDALVLLEDATCKDRAWLLAHPEFEIDNVMLSTLTKHIERRSNYEPLAYIRGKSEFYGREFIVTPDTLQPRAETETMIDMLKNLNLKDAVIADIGTGSGCIAITIKLEQTKANVFATEINQAAYEIAKKNAEKLGADVAIHKGNLLEPLLDIGSFPSVLLCNLPYVPNSHTINQAAMQEPKVAIFGGEDGLDLYRELFDQISKIPGKIQYVFTESLPFQHAVLSEIAQEHGYIQDREEDFIQLFSLQTR